jgi:predicted esterase
MHKLICCIALMTALTCRPATAQMTKGEVKQVLQMLQSAPTFGAVIDSLEKHDRSPDSANIATLREALWQRLLNDSERYPKQKANFDAGSCKFGKDQTGKFSLKVKGARPNNGYPVYIGLHGGGGGPKEMNDEQWEQMQSYYLNSIDTGIYVAPRGPNNTWNLHFDSDAQAFYNELLQELRLYAGADPNRIYLLGYSAGGDGVYQLAPRLASQLAAANMSAGHHNGVKADNLEHLPMLLQVGELDSAYHRNIETVKYALILDSLERQSPSNFPHAVFVHAKADHSYVKDRNGSLFMADVIQDPRGWLRAPWKFGMSKAMTDGPTWVAQYVRNPYPSALRWELDTRLEGGRDWYWVSLNLEKLPAPPQTKYVDVRFIPGQNRIEVKQFPGEVILHLHEAMVNSKLPIVIVVDGKDFKILAKPSMLAMAQSMKAHNDPDYSTWQTVRVWRDAQGIPHVD